VTATAQQGRAHWTALLAPRWLAWHAFTVLAIAGMLYLGFWQLHRAESGNELSWAYTFEWPLFAIFACFFWVKSLRDELRGPASGGNSAVTGAADPGSGSDAATSATASPADAEAERTARLLAEVRGHGKWHGWR